MNRLFAAIRFLTILPLPGRRGCELEDLARSLVFFPVVGLFIGALAAAFAWGLGHLLPDLVTGVLTTILLIGVSGGLHMDGASDTADGFFSARPEERVLEIMRDSRIGAMGAIAIVSLFLLKASALAGLSTEVRWQAVLLMPVAGRSALVVSMAILPYMRAEGGIGSPFHEKRPRFAAAWSLFLMGLVGWVVAEISGLIAAGATLGAILLFAYYVYRKIGGSTGDTLGATCEIVECVPPLTLLIWLDVAI